LLLRGVLEDVEVYIAAAAEIIGTRRNRK